MKIQFEKPPVVEALCDFRFQGEWDQTVPTRFHEKWHDRLPLLRTPEKEGEPFRFWSEDETRLVQIAPRILTANFKRFYGSWAELRNFAEEVLRDYVEIAGEQPFSRVGLRYLNAVVVPPDAPFSDYIVAAPTAPPGLETSDQRKVEVSVSHTSLVMNDINGKLIYSLSCRGIMEEGVLLDFDVSTLDVKPVNLQNVFEWLDEAHEEIKNVFLANVTEKARAAFGETNV